MPAREYPVDFAPPQTPEMQAIFDQVGLTGDTTGKRQRTQQIRDALAANGLLFTMLRPVYGSQASPWYHPDYTAAAFRGAPNLRDFRSQKTWLPRIADHLQDFGALPKARTLLSEGVVVHYNRLADVATRLPAYGDKLWIAGGNKTVNDRPALDFTGVSIRNICVHWSEQIRDWSDHGRVYLPLEPIAQHIGWTLPGVEDMATQTAILERFEATRNPNRVVDPQALFMAGRLSVRGAVELPVHALFTPTP